MVPKKLARGLREQIAEDLRLELISGRYQRGEQMVERHLARRFDVSHAPVREALLQLAQEGLLVAQTNYGVRVAPPAAAPIVRLFSAFRQQIEDFALNALFERWGVCPDPWQGSQEEMSQLANSQDAGRLAAADFHWHASLVEATGENDLVQAWRSMVSRVRMLADPGLRVPAEVSQSIVTQHVQMAEFCRAGDRDGALAALERNLAYEFSLRQSA